MVVVVLVPFLGLVALACTCNTQDCHAVGMHHQMLRKICVLPACIAGTCVPLIVQALCCGRASQHRNDICHAPAQLWKEEARQERQENMEALFVQLSARRLPQPDRWLLRSYARADSFDDDSQFQWLKSAEQALAREVRTDTQTNLRAWLR